MYLIVGLGNPGAQYAHTRHNVGFDVIDALARKLGVTVGRAKSDALIGETFVDGQKVILALPQTYMNLSGQAVSALASWYKIPHENLLVIYDDIDLPPGTVRIRPNGSAGTHNGMRSIVGELNAEDFPRIRVGVGERRPGYELADWVLGHYVTPEEQQTASAAYEQAAEGALCFIREGIESAMCKYNTRKQKKPKGNDAEGERE
ncbi:MAG: aminoacyl-tRNA hydrolase [Eubacteriales bacterium]|nr:aminoacyl-tRNA hydrolase [Eubacteriales bacterium]